MQDLQKAQQQTAEAVRVAAHAAATQAAAAAADAQQQKEVAARTAAEKAAAAAADLQQQREDATHAAAEEAAAAAAATAQAHASELDAQRKMREEMEELVKARDKQVDELKEQLGVREAVVNSVAFGRFSQKSARCRIL